MTQKNQYAIGAVAKLTGVSTHLIRAWEKRHGAVRAVRSASGRRLFDLEDVQKLSLLKRLIAKGSSIGAIAQLSVAELRERLDREARVLVTARAVRVACYGANVGRLLTSGGDRFASIGKVVVNTTDIEHFRSGIGSESPDLLVVEVTNLVDATIPFLAGLQALGKSAAILVVFAFGRGKLEQELQDRGIGLVRSPLTAQELAMAMDALVGPVPASHDAQARQEDPLPATRYRERRFSDQALDQIARLAPAIECECPHHLADLVRMLSAFEVYSQNCENRGAADAAMHGELFQFTAQARSTIEQALARVLEVEGVSVEGT